MGMTTKQPSIGDRVAFHNPICEADRFGTVIAKRETRFGVDFQVQLEEAPDELKHFGGYVGTAQDRGGYIHTLNNGGIGAYLIVA
jgi:hypothetical protein